MSQESAYIQEAVRKLLTLSSSLRDAYEYYQDLTYIVTVSHDEKPLESILNPTKSDKQYTKLPESIKKARKTLKKHKEEITNSFKYNFSNGPLEGINNKIKVIIRTVIIIFTTSD
ncbi:transposase [Fructilactobacillus sanfranciscensis]|uniref:transposase n=1 Tax=Fructilactobacillus sanfranciscensis TaxID=1625 RepID=UPI0013D478B4|nr:transposase [Fructilactobacillus sanfranciscensis]NDR77676.1 hypothetical protein [Fructilactobacillus sanfranciscensis]